MIYRKWNEISKLPNKMKLWACAYDLDATKGVGVNNHRPFRTIITSDGWINLTVAPDGRCVDLHNYVYADTYEECVQLYNDLIKEKVSWFERRISECKNELIDENLLPDVSIVEIAEMFGINPADAEDVSKIESWAKC